MRRFEEQYRLNEGDDVLNRENAIHQDVDLRLDAVEQDAEAFRAGNRADIEAILKSLEQTFGTLAAEMRGLLDQTVGGLSADIVVETPARYFLTDARRGAILSDLRGGVDASGDTLAKLLALIVGVVGGAPTGRQSLKAINDAVVANTATLSAITNGADPTLDSFAEALTRFVIDEGQISSLMTMVGSRLRLDAPGGYTDAFRGQGRANLLGAPASVTTSGTFSVADVGRKVRASGTITRTLPAISSVFAGWSTGEIENSGTGIVTVAAGAGDAFEGVAAGSLALFPKQRAYFYLDADGWHIGWVEQAPIVAQQRITTGVAMADFNLPVGYGRFRIRLSSISFSATPTFGYWLSDNGTSGIKSGANDYSSTRTFGNASPNTGTQGVSDSYAYLIQGGYSGAGFKYLSEFTLDPGAAGTGPCTLGRGYFVDSTPNRTLVTQGSDYIGTTSGPMGRVNLIRFRTTTGTFTANVTIWGEP